MAAVAHGLSLAMNNNLSGTSKELFGPPVNRAASLGSSALLFVRSRSGIEIGRLNRMSPKRFGRGVLYDA
jgi:hypothetical protein